MMEIRGLEVDHKSEACLASINAVRDALYVLSGKWKLPLILALSNGSKRFKDIQRALDGITPKILSKELKDLEMREREMARIIHDFKNYLLIEKIKMDVYIEPEDWKL